MLLFILLSLLFIVFSYFYLKIRSKYSYWTNRNVVQAGQPTFFLGNYGDWILQRKCIGKNVQNILRKYPNEPYVGAYLATEPVLIVQDPELVKLITTKEFYYFNSRDIMDHTYREPIGRVLLFSYGEMWKVVRQNVTPLFSTAKMKNMFYLIEKCAHRLEDFIDVECEKSLVIDAKDIMVKYTMQCICDCAFGIDTNTFHADGNNNQFVKIGDAIFENSIVRGIALLSRSIYPGIFYGLGLKVFPTEISDFFHKVMISIFEARNYMPTKRNDFIDLILTLKQNKYIEVDSLKKGSDEKISVEVDDELLVSQCVLFFAGGFETSSSNLSFTLYELAKNKDAQERAIAEVDAYLEKHKNKLDYDCVSELVYLDACLHEALRLYPAVQVITREVYEDYTLPSGLKLERGTRIHIPAYHYHRDPRNFPDPETFRPERHLVEEKHNIKPYTFLPFGEGPRICIGKRFSSMQTLTGLMTVLKKYRVELGEGVTRNMDMVPNALISQPKFPVHLKFIKREGWETRIYDRSTSRHKEQIPS